MERIEKKIGKIKKVEFGLDYDGRGLFGLTLCVGSDKEQWGSIFQNLSTIKKSLNKDSEWNQNRNEILINMIENTVTLLEDAKVNHIAQLEGIPVEVTFKNNWIQSVRILTEVL